MYYVYILTNWNNTICYTGVTNNIQRRLFEHRSRQFDGFTKRYNVHKLVYFDSAPDIKSAIDYEKRIKGWNRKRKNALIESMNPDWKDLSSEF
ncbi:MAG: GIY-YIG nuclease family protein [Clostridiales bacterium]|jgi:putative endonuclease|nr:GIY-YIG nuclease family protein [Clostridiales bacterium]